MLRKGIIQIASSSMLEEHLLKNTSCHEEHICTCLLLAVVCAMAGNSDDKQMVPHASFKSEEATSIRSADKKLGAHPQAQAQVCQIRPY